jgi:hypothetical protein
MAAPPTVVCGQTLSTAASGAVVEDVTRPGAVITVSGTSSGGVVLRLARGCSRGVALQIHPTGTMRIRAAAYSHDHKLVAVALTPHARNADVRIVRPDASDTRVNIRLPSP